MLCTSTRTGEGIEKLKAELAGKVSVLAGPSGVGKSSLLNALIPGLSLETGSLSEKIQRGKNTTRCAQLLRLEDEVGFVADTAGFTSLRLTDVTPQTLADAYPEFAPYREECYFPGAQSYQRTGMRRAACGRNGTDCKGALRRLPGPMAGTQSRRTTGDDEMIKISASLLASDFARYEGESTTGGRSRM